MESTEGLAQLTTTQETARPRPAIGAASHLFLLLLLAVAATSRGWAHRPNPRPRPRRRRPCRIIRRRASPGRRCCRAGPRPWRSSILELQRPRRRAALSQRAPRPVLSCDPSTRRPLAPLGMGRRNKPAALDRRPGRVAARAAIRPRSCRPPSGRSRFHALLVSGRAPARSSWQCHNPHPLGIAAGRNVDPPRHRPAHPRDVITDGDPVPRLCGRRQPFPSHLPGLLLAPAPDHGPAGR